MNEPSRNPPGPSEARDLATLQAQMLRPAQAANMDGSFELGWGTALLCFGLVSYVNAALPKSWASSWASWIGFLPLLCAAFAPYAIPKIIKRFITWPRTGYVANLHDVKLKYLVMLMIFGGALGFALSLPFVLFLEINTAMGHPAEERHLYAIIRHGIELIICVTVVIWLGRKVIRKRLQPLPAAYDAPLINQGLKQTAAGRKTMRAVRFTIALLFAGIPILACGAVLGLVYLSEWKLRYEGMSWPELGVLCFMIAMNAVLYLMGNGVAIRQHRWKWLVLVLMLIGPILITPAIPYPVIKELPVLQQFPPLMLSIGLLWCLSGAVSLIWFIRHNPLPSREAE